MSVETVKYRVGFVTLPDYGLRMKLLIAHASFICGCSPMMVCAHQPSLVPARGWRGGQILVRYGPPMGQGRRINDPRPAVDGDMTKDGASGGECGRLGLALANTVTRPSSWVVGTRTALRARPLPTRRPPTADIGTNAPHTPTPIPLAPRPRKNGAGRFAKIIKPPWPSHHQPLATRW